MIRALVELPEPAPEQLVLRGERFHHLVHVLRVAEGDVVELFDGRGRTATATVKGVGASELILTLGPLVKAAGRRTVAVLQGLPKGDKLEWVVEKATELGAGIIAPVATVRAVVKLDAERASRKQVRWQKIAEEAARQCRRADVPEVWPPLPLLTALDRLPAGVRVLVLDEEERQVRLGQALSGLEPGAPLALVVGPEGGLAREEVEALVTRGAVAVSLGQHVLRTETAALAALCVLLHRDGVLG
jgi:16S rRNA (uracil1498-N3)-methyltransferase